MSKSDVFYIPMKSEQIILKGKKVFLRYPKLEDCDELISLNQKNVNFHHNLANPPKSRAGFEEYLEKNKLETNENFLICRLEDGKIAGAINISQIFYGGFQNAYLGYYLGEEFTGEGFVKEAVRLILRFSFVELKLHRIEANIQPRNFASIAVVRANNFKKEGFSEKYLMIGGEWRDHERWAIVRENWKPN